MACLLLFPTGRISIKELFEQQFLDCSDPEISESYLQLLQKFELALQLNKWEVLIPSFLPEDVSFPKPDENLSDVFMSETHDDFYQPPLRRFWFSSYVPEGFWPRLICRVYKDHQVNSVLSRYMSGGSGSSRMYIEWRTWKTGMVFTSRGRTLVALKLLKNEESFTKSVRDGGTGDSPQEEAPGNVPPVSLIKGMFRIEMHIFVPEMINIMRELMETSISHRLFHSGGSLDDGGEDAIPFNATGHATTLMVAISNHIVSLSSWFSGMIPQHSSGYAPCWKCYAGIEGKGSANCSRPFKGGYINVDGRLVYSLPVDECILPGCKNKDLACSVHKQLKTVHQVPDVVSYNLQ